MVCLYCQKPDTEAGGMKVILIWIVVVVSILVLPYTHRIFVRKELERNRENAVDDLEEERLNLRDLRRDIGPAGAFEQKPTVLNLNSAATHRRWHLLLKQKGNSVSRRFVSKRH